jgi:hypothetical protein
MTSRDVIGGKFFRKVTSGEVTDEKATPPMLF